MRDYTCPEERFLKDTAQHTMTVLRDDGVHRHIRFKRPNEGAYWFDLITWPGTLCIDGDMGTHVFRRLEDMFEFFRTDRDWMREGATLAINPSYWGEKLQATSNFGKFKEFSEARFRENVRHHFDNWCEDAEPDSEFATKLELDEFEELKQSLWDDIEEEVLSHAYDGETRAMDAALAFNNDEADFNFEDAWEWHCQEYTFHFIWCCYAIAWGVKTYDEAKAAIKEAA